VSEWIECTDDFIIETLKLCGCFDSDCSWNDAGLHLFQLHKVIWKIQGFDTPSPTATLSFTDNIFETTLLHSSPSDMMNMHKANKALQVALNSPLGLNSSQKDYIKPLNQKA